MRGRYLHFVIVLILVALILWGALKDYITIDALKAKRDVLTSFADSNYAVAASVFVLLFFSTAFFVPGAIVLSLAGGLLFGVIPGTLYISIGGALGALSAFLISRYMVGNWVQRKYHDQLTSFNRAIKERGINYLLFVRIIPVAPFFVINFVAGLTKIPARTFFWTTLFGMLPGSLVYTFAGTRLEAVNTAHDLYSVRIVLPFILAGVLVMLPVLADIYRRYRGQGKAG